MPAYCEVALPLPLDHTFTYGVRLGQQPQRGVRVIAPFRNENLIGVVTALNTRRPRQGPIDSVSWKYPICLPQRWPESNRCSPCAWR